MNSDRNIDSIFCAAVEISSGEDRASYLDEVCGSDAELRERLDHLLAAHDHAGGFMRDDDDPGMTIAVPKITEVPGSVIDRYKLMEQIGEGGMGVVFVAEQQHPVKRKVAMKIVKPGMDSKEVIARFEAERQALAMMDHPNVAKVFDAGSTESGRPYFVMELVRGIRITDYCDQNTLTVRERLKLFVQVCRALQHAHQKGIIHRDIKPSNVLVTLHDSRPVPKIIDFGIAKATNQRLTERTIYTRFAQIVGTPIYMSPEQAELSGLDIDTRSDIYSLGVLLYELLTGATPFERGRFEKAAFDEMRRIVREEDPPKPSTRVSALGQTATSVSLHRGTDPRGLSKFLVGDLDVLVMKALEKDRTRRYDTASGLADDVERFLNSEPIVARSPSWVYRFGKFARRNRVAMATGTLVATSLVFGIIITGGMAHVAWEQVQETRRLNSQMAGKNAELRRKSVQLEEAYFSELVAAVLAGSPEKAERALKVIDAVGGTTDASLYRIEVLKGLIAHDEGRYDEAIDYADQALKAMPEGAPCVAARALLAAAAYQAGDDDRWQDELAKFQEVTPQSETDQLLKIIAIMHWDPVAASELMKELPNIERSPVGLLVRACSGFLTATDQHDAELMDEALEDLEYARFFFRNNPVSLFRSVQAFAGAIEMAKHDERYEVAQRLARQGRLFADQLASIENYPTGDYALWLFYRATDETELASEAVHRLGRNAGTYSFFLAAALLRQEDAVQALREFDEITNNSSKDSVFVALARLHLLRNVPDGAPQVRTIAEDVLAENPPPLTARYALAGLCLIGDRPEVQKQALNATLALEQEQRVMDVLYGAGCVTYLTGQEDSEFLKKSDSGAYSQCMAYFTIGMMRLADGDRDGASRSCELAAATNAIGTYDYELAKAYHERMTRNPSWPTWCNQRAVE